jgi:vacuolar-type H+-ATPase subunit H
VGLAVPSSSVEDEKLGPVADRVKDQAKETGQEALDRGKEVAQSAADTVSEEGRKHGEKLADSAKENAASVR